MVGEEPERFILPASVDDLAKLYAAEPNATIVAGATDVGLWVTKFMRDISPIIHLAHLEELRRVDARCKRYDAWCGRQLQRGLSFHHSACPAASRTLEPYRWSAESATWGPSAAISPTALQSATSPPALIALGASVTLRKNEQRRVMLLEHFFIEYGKQDRQPGEFVNPHIPSRGSRDARYAVYKVTKRLDEDISAVCGAFRVSVDDTGRVSDAVDRLRRHGGHAKARVKRRGRLDRQGLE